MDFRILVVDDDPKITAMIRRALIYEGYSVDVARDWVSALSMNTLFCPQLTILDISAKIEACPNNFKHLKSASNTSILLLNDQSEIKRDLGEDIKADGYLVKPFTISELLQCIEHLLGTKPPPDTCRIPCR